MFNRIWFVVREMNDVGEDGTWVGFLLIFHMMGSLSNMVMTWSA
jgi:hypothetical protein